MKRIQAEGFELVDESGKTRALLGVSKVGPTLALFDQNAKASAGLGVSDVGIPGASCPGFVLRDRNGMLRVRLNLKESGEPVLALYDQNGKTRASLFMDESGAPGLALYGADGKVVWQAP